MARRTTFQWQADGAEDRVDRISRSEKKRRALALQNLGEKLAKFDSLALASLALPAALVQAFEELRTFSGHEARRRQIQFIGRLMRDLSEEEVGQIEALIAERHGRPGA